MLKERRCKRWAKIALELGVSCITVHLREDRRHMQDDDIYRIRELDNCRLNLEMAASEEIIEIALDVKPDQVTLVPERREELTTEGGLDVARTPTSHDIVLNSLFENMETLEKYRVHHEHTKVLETIRKVCSSTVKIDYKT